MKMLHGGDVYNISKRQGIEIDKLLDFSANINPLGMPEGVKSFLCENMSHVIHYPDPFCSALKEALALEEKVETNEILCGNGAADLIYRIGYGLRPKKALLAEPTFSEYREALSQVDCSIQSFLLNRDFQLTDDFLGYLTEELDILFICNPNNPTGLLIDSKLLHTILKKAKEKSIIVVLDECFLDFVKEGKSYSMQPYLKEYDNLLILKSFTKMYAFPGIRLGYLLSSNKCYLEKIQKAGQTWSVNSFAQAAGVQAVLEKEFVKKTLEYVEKESLYLKGHLLECGFHVFDGKANYIFFSTNQHKNLYDKMLNHNIIIRKCSNYMGLDERYFRIAVRKHSENELFVKALKAVLKEKE